MYEANVRPYLDFILGYEDLSALDPLGDGHRWTYSESWDEVLGRYDIRSQYTQVAKVFQVKLSPAKQDVLLQLAIFLSRKGTWIIWHKRYNNLCRESSEREYIAVFDTVQDMCAFLSELIADGYKFHYQYGLESFPRYAPLRIARGLLELLQSTIEKRQTYLETFQSAQKEGFKRLSVIRPAEEVD